MIRHRTPGEKRTQAAAEGAVTRAMARARPPEPPNDDQRLGELFPFITPARAQQIRHEIQETQC
jgi:hypothetical protein